MNPLLIILAVIAVILLFDAGSTASRKFLRGAASSGSASRGQVDCCAC